MKVLSQSNMYTCSVRIVPHDSWIVFSDELRTEILSLMYNVATLQDGVENIHEFCPSLISLSMQALRKTHSDPLRTNCVGVTSIPFHFITISTIDSAGSLNREMCLSARFV